MSGPPLVSDGWVTLELAFGGLPGGIEACLMVASALGWEVNTRWLMVRPSALSGGEDG